MKPHRGHPRHPALFALFGLLCLLPLPGCQTTSGSLGGPPWLDVPPGWMQAGTMVMYMPKQVAATKQAARDPVFNAWFDALLDYADLSSVASRVLDQSQALAPSVRISSKTIPSSDYSVLLIGTGGRAVHVFDSWGSVDSFLSVDPYLLGRAKAAGLPKGCEAIRVRVPGSKDDPKAAAAAKREAEKRKDFSNDYVEFPKSKPRVRPLSWLKNLVW